MFAFPDSILQQYRHTPGIWKVPTLELVKCLEEVRDVIRTGTTVEVVHNDPEYVVDFFFLLVTSNKKSRSCYSNA